MRFDLKILFDMTCTEIECREADVCVGEISCYFMRENLFFITQIFVRTCYRCLFFRNLVVSTLNANETPCSSHHQLWSLILIPEVDTNGS